ncbi:urease accessory protein UreD [Haloferula chungangensis]|uniref:Urease accessory protein UreD n=1 Tax=Haloferula chungangensis TaxID=1048331 RepID=A0ABW2L9J0_9BACT
MALTSKSLDSNLRLAFESQAGVTRLTHRQAGGLCHIGKPYWDGRTLLTQLINPTAGLFSGDRLKADITLGENSSVLLSSPSACRLHSMESGSSEVVQQFTLGPNSHLEVLPDLLIPQASSHGSVRTRIDLHESASLAFLDILAPGRLAHGESLAFRHFATALDIYRDGLPLARERARLTPSTDAWRLQTHVGQPAFVATLWLHLPRVDGLSELLSTGESLLSEKTIHVGATELAPHFGVFRLLTPCSLSLRKACLHLREHLAPSIPQLLTRTGKF